MSTTHRLFDEEERDEFIAELKEWPNTDWGTDEVARHSVSPFTSFYFPPTSDNQRDIALLMVDIHEAFEQLLGHPYTMTMHEDAERPHPYPEEEPDLRMQAMDVYPNDYFVFWFTDEANHASSPTTAGHFWRSRFQANGTTPAYSWIVFHYRWQWWLDNRDAWRQFVLKTIDLLKAHQVYSGFAMANPMEYGTRAEVTTWERALAPAFYGLDIEYAYGMDDELPNGIRPPTWAFLLADHWRKELDLTREQVREALAHPRINITELHSGQWIELGEQPELHPVEHGVPELPMLLNKLLKPIRYDDLGLLGFGQWDGDPNERFTDADSRRWMARFDADSDWPTPAVRLIKPKPPAHARHAHSHQPAPRAGRWEMESNRCVECTVQLNERLPLHEGQNVRWLWTVSGMRARSGETCPYPGKWVCDYKPGSERLFDYAALMPRVDGEKVVWRWLGLVQV